MSEPRNLPQPCETLTKGHLGLSQLAKPRKKLKNTFRSIAERQNSFKTRFRSLRYNEINSKHAFAMSRRQFSQPKQGET